MALPRRLAASCHDPLPLPASRREVRISVHGLGPGMFVSRLDRPWLETAFPPEGLTLHGEEEIDRLRRICSHVYIDTCAGHAPNPRHLDVGACARRPMLTPMQDELAALRRTEWTLETEFEAELRHAQRAHDTLRNSLAEAMGDLQAGQRLDLDKLRLGVAAMIESILRNPAAFAWLKEIRPQDEYAYHHAMGCAIWGATFGRHLGLERAELHDLALAGLLSDVGKTRLPHALLLKPGPLTTREDQCAREHLRHSLDIVRATPGLPPRIIEAIATHHERHDGSGYPHGLAGEQIPLFGRLIGLVDSYDAMTSARPYAGSRSSHQAVAELYAQRDRLFQAELVDRFIQACGIYPTGALVELSTGEVGVVTAVHTLKRLRPQVMLLLDADKQPLAQFRPLDLSQVDSDAAGNPLTVEQGLPSGAYGIDPCELFLD